MGHERVKWFTGEERVRRPLWKKLDAHYDKQTITMRGAPTKPRTMTRGAPKNGYGGRVANNWARTMENRGKQCAWNGRMHVRAHGPKNVNARKRERTGYYGHVAKNWAHHGKRVKTMCVAWTDERTGTRAKKRELEETGKHGV